MSFSACRVCPRNPGRYSGYSGSGNLYAHPEDTLALPGEKRNEWLGEIKSEFLFGQPMLSFSPFWFNHKEPLSLQKAMSVTVCFWPRGSLSPSGGVGRWRAASLRLLKESGVTQPDGRPRTWALLLSFSTGQCFEDSIPGIWQYVLIKYLLRFLLLENCIPSCLLGWYKQGRHWENFSGALNKI